LICTKIVFVDCGLKGGKGGTSTEGDKTRARSIWLANVIKSSLLKSRSCRLYLHQLRSERAQDAENHIASKLFTNGTSLPSPDECSSNIETRSKPPLPSSIGKWQLQASQSTDVGYLRGGDVWRASTSRSIASCDDRCPGAGPVVEYIIVNP
jgi:hypothetical protein